jgi:hypothetical protein
MKFVFQRIHFSLAMKTIHSHLRTKSYNTHKHYQYTVDLIGATLRKHYLESINIIKRIDCNISKNWFKTP